MYDKKFNAEESRKDYFSSRANDLFYTKNGELQKQFGLREDVPSNDEEIIQRIKDGAYTLVESDCPYANKRIRWATTPKNLEEYKKAIRVLQDALDLLIETYMLKTPDESFIALQEFKNWKYTPTA